MTPQRGRGRGRGSTSTREKRTSNVSLSRTREPANKRARHSENEVVAQQTDQESNNPRTNSNVESGAHQTPTGAVESGARRTLPDSNYSDSGPNKASGVQQMQPESHNPSSTPNDKTPFKRIPFGLITGADPAINPTVRGLEYVPLVKAEGDEDKPDLIRVLIVHAAEQGQPLECSIKIRLLPLLDARGKAKTTKVDGIDDSDLPMDEYVALSYAWEGQTPTEDILIRHPTAGKLPLRVTLNLKSALIALRRTRKESIFWADAICMDQNDNAEKSQQLPLMSRIYSEAKYVCIWLGNEDLRTKQAFKLMGKIRVWQNFKTVVEDETDCDEWVAFNDLMKRPWFKRRWVVQEIVLAGRAQLWCGSQCIEWMHFAQAVAFFEAMRDRVKSKFRRAELYDNHPDMFGEVLESSASRLVKVTADIVSRSDDGRVVRKVESLESLISTLTPFQTGERKDIVYAILSLAKDVTAIATAENAVVRTTIKMSDLKPELREELRQRGDGEKMLRALNQIMRNIKVDRFPVNYDKKFGEVCDDLYTFTTLHSKSLDLICRPWCPRDPREKLPSWVRQMKDHAFKLDKAGHTVRVNADTLVGLPGRSPYQASARIGGKWSFERDGGPKGTQIMSAQGF